MKATGGVFVIDDVSVQVAVGDTVEVMPPLPGRAIDKGVRAQSVRLLPLDPSQLLVMMNERDRSLFDQLQKRFESEIMPRTGPEFIAAKMAEREERHRQMGNTRYVVEPNVKDGKGGLRDLNTLFWIGKYFYRVRTSAELVGKGVLSSGEYRLFQRAEDFLWAIRCNMHFLTGRADEKLTFDLQPDLAERLLLRDEIHLVDGEDGRARAEAFEAQRVRAALRGVGEEDEQVGVPDGTLDELHHDLLELIARLDDAGRVEEDDLSGVVVVDAEHAVACAVDQLDDAAAVADRAVRSPAIHAVIRHN